MRFVFEGTSKSSNIIVYIEMVLREMHDVSFANQTKLGDLFDIYS